MVADGELRVVWVGGRQRTTPEWVSGCVRDVIPVQSSVPRKKENGIANSVERVGAEFGIKMPRPRIRSEHGLKPKVGATKSAAGHRHGFHQHACD